MCAPRPSRGRPARDAPEIDGVLEDFLALDAEAAKKRHRIAVLCGALMRQRVDRDRVAGFHGDHGCAIDRELTPDDGLGPRPDVLRRRRVARPGGRLTRRLRCRLGKRRCRRGSDHDCGVCGRPEVPSNGHVAIPAANRSTFMLLARGPSDRTHRWAGCRRNSPADSTGQRRMRSRRYPTCPLV